MFDKASLIEAGIAGGAALLAIRFTKSKAMWMQAAAIVAAIAASKTLSSKIA